MVDRMMCSMWCPCPADAESVWTAVDEAELAKFTRQDTTRTPMNATQCADFFENQMYAETIPLQFSTTVECGVVSFENDADIETVNNYGDCYNNNLKPIFDSYAETTDPDQQEMMDNVQKFFDEGGYEFLGELEERYSCASMCEVPLFYLKKNVADGPPEVDCVTAAIDDLSDNMVIAVLFIITGLLCLIAAAATFPLCSGKSKKKDGDMMSKEDA